MTEMTNYQNNALAAQQNNGWPSPAPVMPTPSVGLLSEIATTTQNRQLSDLLLWADAAQAVNGLAQGLANSTFVPKEFQGKPDNVTAAILKGASIGLDPMQAVNAFDVIHGRPSMRARAMSAVVMGKGHQLKRGEATEQQVTYHAKRKDENQWQEFTWTIARATKAGYTGNEKYQKDPIAMLTAKAITEACRIVFPDVVEGIAITEEIELGDYDDTPAQAPTPQAGAKRVQRKTPPKPVAAAPVPTVPPAPQFDPVADEETGEVIEAPAEVKYITKADQGRIKAGFDQLGVTDRAEVLGIVREWVQAPDLKGANGLTHEQGQAVLARLERELEIERANAEQAPAQ